MTWVGRELGVFCPDVGEQPDNNKPRIMKAGNPNFLIILSSYLLTSIIGDLFQVVAKSFLLYSKNIFVNPVWVKAGTTSFLG